MAKLRANMEMNYGTWDDDGKKKYIGVVLPMNKNCGTITQAKLIYLHIMYIPILFFQYETVHIFCFKSKAGLHLSMQHQISCENLGNTFTKIITDFPCMIC